MSPLSTRRHSLSHIMAQATRMVMWAWAKLAIGPDVDNGWYYDIDFGDATLEEAKLKDIEKKMKSIVREGQEFRQFSLSVTDAKTFMKALGEDSYRDLSGIGIPVAKKCKALARDSLSLLAYVK